MPSDDRKPRITGRSPRATPELLKNLRSTRVALFHPKDGDGELLTRQLQRIGCQVQAFWPPLAELPETVDVVICAVRPEMAPGSCNWIRADRPLTVIAVIDYENPTIVDAVLKLGARGVLISPVRSAGVLSSLVLSMSLAEELRESRKRIARLEQKLESANLIGEAKSILAHSRGVSTVDAYRMLREQAMAKRVPVEQIAQAIIQANEILGAERPGR